MRATIPPAAARRALKLATLLDDVATLNPEHRWEGEFTGTRGAAAGYEIGVRASLRFDGTLMEGAGRGLDFTTGYSEADSTFTLTGQRLVASVHFQLCFAAELIRREPFVGTGLLSSDEREMSGEWSARCFNPETCGCDGGGGKFRLNRID